MKAKSSERVKSLHELALRKIASDEDLFTIIPTMRDQKFRDEMFAKLVRVRDATSAEFADLFCNETTETVELINIRVDSILVFRILQRCPNLRTFRLVHCIDKSGQAGADVLLPFVCSKLEHLELSSLQRDSELDGVASADETFDSSLIIKLLAATQNLRSFIHHDRTLNASIVALLGLQKPLQSLRMSVSLTSCVGLDTFASMHEMRSLVLESNDKRHEECGLITGRVLSLLEHAPLTELSLPAIIPLQTQNVVQFDFPRLAQLSVTCSLEASPQLADKLSSDLTELSLALFHEAKQEELGTGKTDAELINELVSTLVRKLPNLTSLSLTCDGAVSSPIAVSAETCAKLSTLTKLTTLKLTGFDLAFDAILAHPSVQSLTVSWSDDQCPAPQQLPASLPSLRSFVVASGSITREFFEYLTTAAPSLTDLTLASLNGKTLAASVPEALSYNERLCLRLPRRHNLPRELIKQYSDRISTAVNKPTATVVTRRFVPDRRVLLLGHACSGKTTALYRWHLGEQVSTIPTIGFNVETVKLDSGKITVWDVGGQDKLRPLWRHYLSNTDLVVYFFNSAEEIEPQFVSLKDIFDNEELKTTNFLILAGCADLIPVPDGEVQQDVIDKYVEQLQRRVMSESDGLQNIGSRRIEFGYCTADPDVAAEVLERVDDLTQG